MGCNVSHEYSHQKQWQASAWVASSSQEGAVEPDFRPAQALQIVWGIFLLFLWRQQAVNPTPMRYQLLLPFPQLALFWWLRQLLWAQRQALGVRVDFCLQRLGADVGQALALRHRARLLELPERGIYGHVWAHLAVADRKSFRLSSKGNLGLSDEVMHRICLPVQPHSIDGGTLCRQVGTCLGRQQAVQLLILHTPSDSTSELPQLSRLDPDALDDCLSEMFRLGSMGSKPNPRSPGPTHLVLRRLGCFTGTTAQILTTFCRRLEYLATDSLLAASYFEQSGFQTLKEVRLIDTAVSLVTVEALRSLSWLESLTCTGFSLDPASDERNPPLEAGCVPLIATMTRLCGLALTVVDPCEVAQLVELSQLRCLTALELDSDCIGFDNDSGDRSAVLVQLLAPLQSLQSLKVTAFLPSVDAACLAALCRLPRLTLLHAANIAEQPAEHVGSLPALRDLRLGDELSAARVLQALQALLPLPELRSVTIRVACEAEAAGAANPALPADDVAAANVGAAFADADALAPDGDADGGDDAGAGQRVVNTAALHCVVQVLAAARQLVAVDVSLLGQRDGEGEFELSEALKALLPLRSRLSSVQLLQIGAADVPRLQDATLEFAPHTKFTLDYCDFDDAALMTMLNPHLSSKLEPGDFSKLVAETFGGGLTAADVSPDDVQNISWTRGSTACRIQ